MVLLEWKCPRRFDRLFHGFQIFEAIFSKFGHFRLLLLWPTAFFFGQTGSMKKGTNASCQPFYGLFSMKPLKVTGNGLFSHKEANDNELCTWRLSGAIGAAYCLVIATAIYFQKFESISAIQPSSYA